MPRRNFKRLRQLADEIISVKSSSDSDNWESYCNWLAFFALSTATGLPMEWVHDYPHLRLQQPTLGDIVPTFENGLLHINCRCVL